MTPPYPSGSWRGFYVQARRRSGMSLGLTFEGGRMGGTGSDPVGSFIVTGSYDETGNVTFLKQYVGGHEVDYSGRPSGKGIAGWWTIAPHFADHFRIWPSDGDGDDEELVEDVPAEQAVHPAGSATPAYSSGGMQAPSPATVDVGRKPAGGGCAP